MKENKNTVRDVIIIKICCLCYIGKYKTFIYNSINAKSWLLAYHLPTNTKILMVLSKILLWWHFRFSKVSHFCQFIHNAFLGKIRLNQSKINFCLKVIKKINNSIIYALSLHPPCKIRLSFWKRVKLLKTIIIHIIWLTIYIQYIQYIIFSLQNLKFAVLFDSFAKLNMQRNSEVNFNGLQDVKLVPVTTNLNNYSRQWQSDKNVA